MSIKKPIDIEYMNATFCVFRSAPSSRKNDDYIYWLNKVETKKGRTWKAKGIYDLVQLSKVGPPYCHNMFVASLYF